MREAGLLIGPLPEQMAVAIANRYIGIQTCEEGYDYSIYNEYHDLLDGGVYDNPEITIKEALEEVIKDLKVLQGDTSYYHTSLRGNVQWNDIPVPVGYDELMEKVEAAESKRMEMVLAYGQINESCGDSPMGEYFDAEWDDGSSTGCKDCPDDECTGHCMSCAYRPV